MVSSGTCWLIHYVEHKGRIKEAKYAPGRGKEKVSSLILAGEIHGWLRNETSEFHLYNRNYINASGIQQYVRPTNMLQPSIPLVIGYCSWTTYQKGALWNQAVPSNWISFISQLLDILTYTLFPLSEFFFFFKTWWRNVMQFLVWKNWRKPFSVHLRQQQEASAWAGILKTLLLAKYSPWFLWFEKGLTFISVSPTSSSAFRI